ncbi:hypothetical protein K6Y31_06130 [Motilimonas cestriensis]|uniref:Uncharacterized protein n=1 Tax=Motilimonas cestriensis TaxID=2742685 RepID=A0ABS8W754_9GAMM|nr:hypothetical protein [Motilimonas cestriensis]MCE2594388.1 hypothetical protein [Motilimonas cestriensis]
MPEDGVLVVKRLALKQEEAEIQFERDRHIEEVLAGVQSANEKHNGNLEVQEIEVVPNDYPQRGQVMSAAFKIAEHVLTKNIYQAQAVGTPFRSFVATSRPQLRALVGKESHEPSHTL